MKYQTTEGNYKDENGHFISVDGKGINMLLNTDVPFYIIVYLRKQLLRIRDIKRENKIKLSQCPACYCMTKTKRGKCGKCKAKKL